MDTMISGNKYNIHVIMLCMLLSMIELHADTVITAEAGKVRGMDSIIGLYAWKHDGNVPESWEELADFAPELRTPESPFAVGKGVSEEYSLLPPALRTQFPDGMLLLIRYHPMQYPDAYKSKLPQQIDPATLTPEQLQVFNAEIERDRQRNRPIRYFVVQAPAGQLTSGWLYEDEIQPILRKAGITIPRPAPYYPKGPDGEYLPLTPQAVEALVRLDLTDTIPPELLAKMQTTGTLPAALANRARTGNATAPGASSPANAPSTLAQILGSPWAAWALAATVIVTAVLYFRRQRVKRG